MLRLEHNGTRRSKTCNVEEVAAGPQAASEVG
jgi:hypothetical protein